MGDPPAPLFKEVRELILRKCAPDKEKQVRAIFEKQPFGELERLVTQKLLDVVKRVAKEELESENWLHLVARLSGRSYEQMRVIILEFLDTDVFNVSVENCVSFLDPLIESWDIDLATFAMEIVLNRRLAPGHPRNLSLSKGNPTNAEEEPGFKGFLRDRFPERRCYRGRNRVSKEAEVQRKTAHSTLLLPGIAKPQRPAPFSSAHAPDPANKNTGPVPAGRVSRPDAQISGG